MQHVHANGFDFAYLEQGSGPLVLMLHGFPDTAHTWSHQMPALAAAGYRVVAPFLRGYHPTAIPSNGYYDKATLVTDVVALIHTLGGGESVHLVGQDWGAIISYAVLAAFPQLIRRAVVMAVPHPAEVAKSMLNPKHVQRSFHWWFFQLPGLPERALLDNDGAFIDYLWTYWSSPGHEDVAHIASIKAIRPSHAQNHQGPGWRISHSKAVSNGTPSARDSAQPFKRSSEKPRGVVRLKPNRCSIPKVRSRANGRPNRLEMAPAAIRNATLRARPSGTSVATRPYRAS